MFIVVATMSGCGQYYHTGCAKEEHFQLLFILILVLLLAMCFWQI